MAHFGLVGRAPRRLLATLLMTMLSVLSCERPMTSSMPLRAIDELLYEYACHEGNFGMLDVLRGARYRDKEEAGKR